MRRGRTPRPPRLALAAALIAALSAHDGARGAAPGAALDPPTPGLGQRAALHLTRAPADSTSRPVGLGVAVLPTADPRVMTVVPLQVGRVGVALPGASDGNGSHNPAQQADTLWWQVPGSLSAAEPDSLRPLKAAPELGPNWLPSLLVVLAALAIPLWWLWQRRRRRPARVIAFPLLAEPPHRVALRQLAEIAATRWLEDGQFERYFVECTRTVRTYIAGRYRVAALDWTSDEIVDRLRQSGYDRRDLADIGPLLAEADKVKFGGDRPTQHTAQQWLERARGFVERTAVEPVFTTPEAVEAAAALTRKAAA